MFTLLVVVDAPCFDRGLRDVERLEMMFVQTFIAQSRIEVFDVPVVDGFARSRKIERHTAHVGPRIERLRGEFCAVIDGDGVR